MGTVGMTNQDDNCFFSFNALGSNVGLTYTFKIQNFNWKKLYKST